MKWFPLFGTLSGTSSDAKKEAAKELGTNVLFSTTPIWLGPFIYLFFRSGEKSLRDSYVEGLLLVTQNGELFLYATALLAPVFYIALSKRRRGEAPYPATFSHMLWFFILYVIAAVFFWIARFVEPAKSTELLITSSVIYGLSIALLFVAFVLKNESRDPVSKSRMETENFLESYRDHRDRKDA